MCTTIVSPGFIISVWESGVTVAGSESCGLGGPVGTPLRWMNPKFTGSVQFGLHEAPSVRATRPCGLGKCFRLAKISWRRNDRRIYNIQHRPFGGALPRQGS